MNEIGETADRFELAHAHSIPNDRKDRYPNSNTQKQNGGKGDGPRKANAEKSSTGDHQVGPRDTITCFRCNKKGHFQRDCPQPMKALGVGAVTQVCPSYGCSDLPANTAPAVVNGHRGFVLYDTGCAYPVLVRTRYVRPTDHTKETVLVQYANCAEEQLPIAWVELDTPYMSGRVKAACMTSLSHDVVLGCKYVLPQPNPETCREAAVVAAVTRAQESKRSSETKPVVVTPLPVKNLLPGELRELQRNDVTLAKCFKRAELNSNQDEVSGKGAYILKNGILFRQGRDKTATKQLVVPQSKRAEVLSLAHAGLFGGHMGMGTTQNRVGREFTWPGVGKDVERFCRSCDRCQRMAPKSEQRPVPLGEVPVVDKPFECVAMDLIGPIHPASGRGHQYILTVMDQATRYPEAVALKTIGTEAVAVALWEYGHDLGHRVRSSPTRARTS